MNEMVDQLKNEDSYAIRRKIFKNIWDAAIQLDGVDAKPKIINTESVSESLNLPDGTVRLDESVKSLSRKKKQRIKNLRTVCKKILEFCDRQDVEDLFLNNALAEGIPPKTNIHPIPKTVTPEKKIVPKKLDTKKKQEIQPKKNVIENKTEDRLKKLLHKNEIEPPSVIVARANLKNIKKTSLEVNKNKKKQKIKRKKPA